jgi:hypothetical protein
MSSSVRRGAHGLPERVGVGSLPVGRRFLRQLITGYTQR